MCSRNDKVTNEGVDCIECGITKSCLNVKEGIEINWEAAGRGLRCYEAGTLNQQRRLLNERDPFREAEQINPIEVTSLIQKLKELKKLFKVDELGNVSTLKETPPNTTK